MRFLWVFLFGMPGVAYAQVPTLQEYLSQMDRTEVTFSGQIQYRDDRGDFFYTDPAGDWFGVIIDAGRDVRERLENECLASDNLFDPPPPCNIVALGTVEIRGDSIVLSLSELTSLER